MFVDDIALMVENNIRLFETTINKSVQVLANTLCCIEFVKKLRRINYTERYVKKYFKIVKLFNSNKY